MGIANADENVKITVIVKVGHLRMSVLRSISRRCNTLSKRNTVAQCTCYIVNVDVIHLIAQYQVKFDITAHIRGYRRRQFVRMGTRVSPMGIRSPIMRIGAGSGKKHTRFRIVNLVAHKHFRMSVMIEVRKTHIDSPIVSALPKISVRHPIRY